MPNPIVKDIIADWLELNGYSGLFCDYCGCELNDLMPCSGWDGGNIAQCYAGYAHHCDGDCELCERNEWCEMDYEFSDMYVDGELP